MFHQSALMSCCPLLTCDVYGPEIYHVLNIPNFTFAEIYLILSLGIVEIIFTYSFLQTFNLDHLLILRSVCCKHQRFHKLF